MGANGFRRRVTSVLVTVVLATAWTGLTAVQAPAQVQPSISAEITGDWISGYNFGGLVTLDIDGATWASDDPAISYYGDTFIASVGDYGFDVQAGQTVTVTGPGETWKSLVVADLRVTGFDFQDNTVTGTTSPAADNLSVAAGRGGIFHEIQVSAVTGSWSADFDDVAYDLRVLDQVTVAQNDDDFDATVLRDLLAPPRLAFGPELQEVVGYDWPAGNPVQLSVDRAPPDGEPEYSFMAIPDDQCDSRNTCPTEKLASGLGNVAFVFDGSFLPAAGDEMTMTNGSTAKTQVVPDLRVNTPDFANAVLSGTTDMPMPAGSFLLTHSGPAWSGGGITHDVTPEPDGSWTTSYFGEADLEEPAALQVDEDGDLTAVNAPVPRVWVDPAADRIWAVDFVPGQVMLTVQRGDDTLHVGNVDTENLLTRGSWNLDMWEQPVGDMTRPTVARFDLAGLVDLQAQDFLTVTDGPNTVTTWVEHLTVGEVDVENNIVAGEADVPVALHMGDGELGYWGYQATPDNGDWSYFFDPDAFPYAGLVPGTGMQAIIGSTVIRFVVPQADFFAPQSEADGPDFTSVTSFVLEYFAEDEPPSSSITTVDLYAKVPGATDYTKVDSATPPGSYFMFDSGGENGLYKFYTVATDAQGNVEEPPAVPDVITVVDTVQPALSDLKAKPNPFDIVKDVRTTVTFVVSERAYTGVVLKLDGVPVRTFPTVSSLSGLVSQTWGGSNDDGQLVRSGLYRIVVTARDRAENKSVAKAWLTVKPVLKAAQASPSPFDISRDTATTLSFRTLEPTYTTFKIKRGTTLVRAFRTVSSDPGVVSRQWAGRDDDGRLVPDGLYTVVMSAVSPGGQVSVHRVDLSVTR